MESGISEKGEMKGLMVLLSPEGLIMIPIAVIFDIATFVCAVLILAYGIGYIAGIIVDIISIPFFTSWSLIRSRFKKITAGEAGAIEESEETEELPKEEEAGETKPSQLQQSGKGTKEEIKTAKTGKTAQAGEEAARAGEEAAKVARGGEEAARATKAVPAASRMARLARWGKIITPIKNAVPFLGLIPTWTPTVYFELQS